MTLTVAVAPGVLEEGRKLTVPGPDFFVHAPVPVVGVLPPRPADTSVPHLSWLVPTVAVVGTASTVILIKEELTAGQTPFSSPHNRVFIPDYAIKSFLHNETIDWGLIIINF